MLWFICFVALVVSAFFFKWARWLLGALGALVVIIATGLWISSENSKREAEAAKHLIPASQVRFEDLQLRSDFGNSYRLLGRIKNESPSYSITAVELNIRLQDCVANACDTVGEETETVWVDVPPGQVRSLNRSVYFSNVPAFRGQWQWQYNVAGISGRK